MIAARSSEFRYAHGPQTLAIRRDREGDGFLVIVGTKGKYAEETLRGDRLADFRAWLAGELDSFGTRRQLCGGLGGLLSLIRAKRNVQVTLTAAARSAALEWVGAD